MKGREGLQGAMESFAQAYDAAARTPGHVVQGWEVQGDAGRA